MEPKLIGIIAAAVIVAAGIGYTIGNPEVVAGLSDDLTGAITTGDRSVSVVAVAAEIADQPIAGLRSVTGCGTVLPTAVGTSGTDKYAMSSYAIRSYQPCVFVAEGTIPTPVSLWMDDIQKGREQHRTVEVAYRDAYGKTVGGFRITKGLLTNVEVSSFDASSQDRIRVTFTVLPELVERVMGDVGSAPTSKYSALSSAFALQVGGVSDVQAIRVQNLSISFPPVETTMGDQLYKTWRAGQPVFGNLSITARDAGTKSLYSTWESEATSGKMSARDIVVQVRASDGTSVLHTLTFASATLSSFQWGLQGTLPVESVEVRPALLTIT